MVGDNLLFPRSTQASLSGLNPTIRGEKYSPAIFTRIVSDFIKQLGYSPPLSDDPLLMTKTQTYQSLYSELSIYNHDEKSFEAMCLTSLWITELSYPHHSHEVKLQIAKFTWYLVYIDDQGDALLPDLRAFQECFFQSRRCENAVLQSFRENLADMYKFWDPIAANCITVSGLEFVTGYIMEEDPAVQDMEVSDVASLWPYFLRRKSGAAEAYAFMIFPKESCHDVSMYIQVVEDITLIINILNDLLSYHKEALAGEKNNYIHARAYVTGRTVSEALQDVANDILAANSRITKVFESTEGATTWKHFITGYTDFTFCAKRYRLRELDF